MAFLSSPIIFPMAHEASTSVRAGIAGREGRRSDPTMSSVKLAMISLSEAHDQSSILLRQSASRTASVRFRSSYTRNSSAVMARIAAPKACA
jgi:hypothetical protein